MPVTAEITRQSKVAVIKEDTAGTLKLPTAGTDFLAVEEDFSFTPAFDIVEDTSLQASIETAKPNLGAENPELSVSGNMKASGVEGQEPNEGALYESSFGSVDIQAIERDVVSSTAGDASNASTITVDTNEGAEMPRGSALLIKHAGFPHEIRNVLSVAGEVLTLAQNVINAPIATTSLGKHVTYTPENSGHPSLSAFGYMADGGAIQAIAGLKVQELTMDVTANDKITYSVSGKGTKFFYDPLIVDATNNKINFEDADVGELVATISSKAYRTPKELAAEIALQMNAVADFADVATVTYSDTTGKFTIASDGGTFVILWKTGTNGADGDDTHIGTLIGFSDAADDTGATSYVADSALSFAATVTPTFSTSGLLIAKENEFFLGLGSDAFNDVACVGMKSMAFTQGTPVTDIDDICEESGRAVPIINSRESSMDIVLYLERFEVERFRAFSENDEVRATYNGGSRTNGNWDPGNAVNLYLAQAVIQEISIENDGGVQVMNLSLKGFPDTSGNPSTYLNFL